VEPASLEQGPHPEPQPAGILAWLDILNIRFIEPSSMKQDFIKLLAAWALFHESADEGWKAAVARGQTQQPGSMSDGPEAFVHGLAALVDEEKERLKARLAEDGDAAETMPDSDLSERLDALAFEIRELRGCVESLQASVDGLAAKHDE